MIIYKVTNKINGKVYIGQTVRSLDERMKEHVRHNQTVFDKAIQKYGVENFVVDHIDSATDIEELNQKEIHWIDVYNSMIPNGYNQCIGGGNTCGFHHREESKQKMSEAKQTAYMGVDNPFYGKQHSDTSKRKMSEVRKGLKHLSFEQIKKLRNSHHTKRVINLDTGEVFGSVKLAADEYNIPATHITRVCKGKRKSCGGFRWAYADEE